MGEEAEARFRAFDFQSDEAWRHYRANINLPPNVDEEEAVEAVKIKWYRRNIDPAFRSSAHSESQTTDTAPRVDNIRDERVDSDPREARMPRIESPRASDRDTTLDNLDPHSGSLLGRTVTKSLRSLNYIVLISSIMHVLCLLLSSEWAYYFYRNAFSMAGWNYFLSLLYLAWQLKPSTWTPESTSRLIHALSQNPNYPYVFYTGVLGRMPFSVTPALVPITVFALYDVVGHLHAHLASLAPRIPQISNLTPLLLRLEALKSAAALLVNRLEIYLFFGLLMFLFSGYVGVFDVALYGMFLWSKAATQRIIRALYETHVKPLLS